MKPLLCTPFNGYLFWGKIGTGLFKNFQYVRHYCGLRAVKKARPEVCCKPILDLGKEKNCDVRKMFTSNYSNDVVLMNFDVWLQPKIIPYFRDLYRFCVELPNLDKGFSLPEFKLCSTEALRVVTNLLSQRRFSELDGLLTPECRREVEENLKRNWKVPQIKVLGVNSDTVLFCAPCEVEVLPDKTNPEKKYIGIRVIYYAWIEYTSEFFNDPQENSIISFMFVNLKAENPALMGVVYNCKFIKEIIEDSSSQWIISAINLRKLYGIFSAKI